MSKNDEIVFRNEELCIKNEECCIKNEEFGIKNDEFCREEQGESGQARLSEEARFDI